MSGDPEEVCFASGDVSLYGRFRRSAEEAPTLVLLSGLGFHTFEYEPLAARVWAAGVNCLSFDFRGHGRSSGRRGRWRLDDLASDTQHAIEFVRGRCSGPIDLFGNSLGAMVAILAAVADDHVRSVAAANCPARIADFLLTPPRRALLTLAKVVTPFVPMRISVGHFYSYSSLIDDAVVVSRVESDPWIADARRLSIPTLSSLIDGWDGSAAVAALHRPLLLIQGRNDRLQPPAQAQLLFDAANEPKELELLDTGHLPHLEAPEAVARVLRKWRGRRDEFVQM